jgi:type II secretory pathway pseudopilin PulG
MGSRSTAWALHTGLRESLKLVKLRKAQGFALIDVIFVCGIIGMLASIAVPRMLLAKQSAEAASAIGSMRAINNAQLTFALTCGGGFYAPDLTTLGTAPAGSNEAFISPGLAAANTIVKSSYTFQMSGAGFAGSPASCNGTPVGDDGTGYKAAGDAMSPGNLRFFATNARGSIWEDTASLWGSMPEIGEPPTGHALR